jgi:thiamine-monophosphate kinase
LGEFGLIGELTARMPAGPSATVGIGDDSAVVAAPSGSVVAAVDMLIEGRHFLRSWSSGQDVGVKAAARSLADIAAMGAVPTALLTAFAAPASLPARWALDLASGVALEASRAGAGVVGGDTASADSVFVSVTALGDLAGRPPVLRSGARAGDTVAVAGTLGRSAAGFALLSAGLSAGSSAGLPADAAGLERLVAAHLRPAPPYEAGPEAARLGATAMIDVSDGLLADLGHVAAASGVAIDLSQDSAGQFLDGPLEKAARALFHRTPHADSPLALATAWVLTGGEDHCLVATFPPPAVAELPGHWKVIGQVLPAGGPDAEGLVTVDGEPYTAGDSGWAHFR